MSLTLQKPTKRLVLYITASIIIVCGIFIYAKSQPSNAANLSYFDPGNIMSDSVMSDKNTMSVQKIQEFLDSKNPCNNTNIQWAKNYPHLRYTIRNGKFICMAQDIFDGETAAQIIWQASQDYSINPRVLIVLLEKEQGLVTDTWPNHIQYRSATGYGCPDTADCDSKYYGLKNQIRHAAQMFRSVLDGGWTNYPIGLNYVRFHPNAACGGTTVNIKNRATSALYRYTPYQPNQAALSAGYGLGDSCSAYGNRNFYSLFTDWFGSTDDGVFIDVTKATQDISATYSQYSNTLGVETGSVFIEYGSTPRAWQNFENGIILWTEKHKAKVITNGSIHSRWRQLGGSLGVLGVPTSNPVTESDGRVWQNFEKGVVIYSEKTGAWEIVPGPIGDTWRQSGGSVGKLGKPTSSVVVSTNGQRRQNFEKGVVIRRDISSPAVKLYRGNVYDAWINNQSSLGVPTSNPVTESDGRVWQNFEKGVIVGKSDQSKAYSVYFSSLHSRWRQLGGSLGVLGVPTSNPVTESDGRVWQNFEKGVIIKSSTNNMFEILYGPIHSRWRQLGGSLGVLGVPTSNPVTESDGRVWQDFEKGVIIYSEKTGAWEIIFGKIHTSWRNFGGSLGVYGKPTSAQTVSESRISQKFEKGTISL